MEEFKENKDKGSVLLAVSTGNFGEGIDLPGDFLKGVVIVGLPLEKPDLETKELIDYYNKKMNTNYPNKIYYILDLFMEYRGLGTLLRIKHNELEKYSERTKNKIIKIKHYAELLNKKYKLKLLVN